jgi:hypothetical protein
MSILLMPSSGCGPTVGNTVEEADAKSEERSPGIGPRALDEDG